MKRYFLILAVACCVTLPLATAAESINYVDRARIVMDLLKDNQVTESDNYASDKVDFISAETATTYADAFCAYYGQYEDGTNAQKAGFFLQCLKRHCKDIRLHVLKREQEATQQQDNETTITTEMGEDETP